MNKDLSDKEIENFINLTNKVYHHPFLIMLALHYVRSRM